MTLGGEDGVDTLEPLKDQLIELARREPAWYVVEEELQIMKCFAAGHLSTVVATHSVGQGQQIALYILGREMGAHLTIAHKPFADDYHIFIVLAYKPGTAGSGYIKIQHD